MKIVLVNTVCGQGSVGRITADLYETVLRHDSRAVVAYGRGSAAKHIVSYKIGNQADFYRHVCRNFFLGESGFGSAGQTRKFLDFLEREKPDLLHLHNLHGFYLQIELLFEYIKKKELPVIWTFHDCWPFTGHCAYYDKNGCGLWQEGCFSCRYHASAYPYALFKDNAAKGFVRKKRAFTGVKNLVIVTPSRWLADEVKKSFLKDYPVEVIPNGIDLGIFSPKAEQTSKERQGLEAGQTPERAVHTVLGVANIWEERKGLSFFVDLAKSLPENYRIRLIGLSKRQKKVLQKEFPSERLLAESRTESLAKLAEAYRQADVFVNPTLEDNFPTANLEALACGTPVVTFQTGGSPETLGDSGMCGISVEKGNGRALLAAVQEVCETRQRAEASGKFGTIFCRKQAEQFEKIGQYDKYFELYERNRKP
ncbi:MAG: glycosyltransferase [Clostridiales bacterium]|nr:glycosyltransferase [Clostridiales bacterium]